ncbi:TonB-dependent receptor plug domain-containing protein [Aurantiacibacter flavus]|uniref:TonB-dependent receptor n=1 Tax=Aurantiacibacter flavus TaxID=3145232 RepID=A0ABV0D0G2_9SPHN
MRHLFWSTSVVACVAASLSTQAAAQADDSDNSSSTIIVTGTRAQGVAASDSAAPIQIVGADAFERVGQPDLTQGLQQNLPSITAQSLGGDSGNFTLSAALRGLNPNHTLVLINGKRRHPSANFQVSPGSGAYQGAAAADLNLIPVDAIARVEVLQDGAAAQYGTDAIAGVINIILKDSATSRSVSLTGGQYFKGDGETGNAQVNLGLPLGNDGYLNLTGEARIHERSQVGGIDYRAQNPDGSVRDDLSDLDAIGVATNENYPYVNIAQGDAMYRLYNFAYNAGYDLGGDTELYSFGTYSHRYAGAFQNYRLPSAVTTDVGGETVALYPTGFSPRQVFREDDFAFTLGLRGEASGWRWDLSSTYGYDTQTLWLDHSANASLYADTETTPTEFYNGGFVSTQWTNNLDISREFEVGLATPLNVAFGAEHRRETFKIKQGDANSTYKEGGQGYPGFQKTDAGDHSRSNVAGYVDLSVDLFEGFQVDLAGRFEHYTDFGDTTIGKLTARYDLSDAIAVRGTVSTGFRAPTLQQEFYSSTTLTPTYAIVLVPANSAGAATAGFSALSPEESVNLSLGLVLNPAPGLQMTIDAYQTDIDDRILSSGFLLGKLGPNVVSQGVLDAIADRGNTLDGTQGYVAMQIFTNAADTRTRGIDATVSYDFDLDDQSRINAYIGFNVNDTEVLRQADLPAAVTSEAFGQVALLGPSAMTILEDATPKWRLLPSLTYRRGAFSMTLRESIYGKVSRILSLNGTGVGGTRQTMGTTAVTDIDIEYEFADGMTFGIGANNLFDKRPDTAPTINDGGVLRPADGTYVYNMPMLASPFGINGGYYYAKLRVNF